MLYYVKTSFEGIFFKQNKKHLAHILLPNGYAVRLDLLLSKLGSWFLILHFKSTSDVLYLNFRSQGLQSVWITSRETSSGISGGLGINKRTNEFDRKNT